MKRKSKTATAHQISAADTRAISRYRVMVLPNLDEQISALAGFLVHRAVFTLNDDLASAASAERAWLQDAAIMASMPAESIGEAHRKTSHLEAELDRWLRDAVRAGSHQAVGAMIEAAVILEQTRWGLSGNATPAFH